MRLAKAAAYSAAAGTAVATIVLAITVFTQSGGVPGSAPLWALRNVVFTCLWPGWYLLLAAKVDASLDWSDTWFALALIASNALIYAGIGSCAWLGRRKTPWWYAAALPITGVMAFVVINGPWRMFELVLWLQAHGQRVH